MEGTNRDRRDVASYRLMDLSTTNATIHRVVYHTYGDASVNLYLSQPAACTTTTKTGSRTVYAVVNTKQNFRSMYWLIGSCQSAATSEIVKRCWSRVYDSCKWRYSKCPDLYIYLYCTIEASDRQEASRGLFATAELLVYCGLVC